MAAKPLLETAGQPADLSNLGLAMAERAPVPMAMVEGASHLVRYGNPAFCRLLDKSQDQLLGKSFGEILPQQDQCVALLDRVFRSGTPESHTEQADSKPHPIFWSYTMWPVQVKDRTLGIVIQVTETAQFHEKTLAMNEALVLGSVRQHELTEIANWTNVRLQKEISERTLVEKALQLAQAQLTDRAGQLAGLVTERTAELTATSNQLEAFVYSIAHDLRAPLRAMQGFSMLLVEEAGASLNETGQGYAGRINKSAQFMDALLTDLLDFSRISQQRVELTSINLEAVIDSVLFRLQKDSQEKSARIENAGPWPLVLAHEPTVAQVLFNLISNALKFVKAGAPPVVRLWSEERAEFVRIWVEDNGPGIAPDYHREIFRLFTRLDGEKYVGTGIGLAIVQKGIERMGGRAGVESALGEGSRFWFELRKAP
ncbi:MAG TPA: PAS domain-containing sensor histidine kinase [Candidatus Saccharimonadales bacterium]|nr:PAS domain-containing sensor histidine kinase [Candidatus Saccharimonadales bacterium]